MDEDMSLECNISTHIEALPRARGGPTTGGEPVKWILSHEKLTQDKNGYLFSYSIYLNWMDKSMVSGTWWKILFFCLKSFFLLSFLVYSIEKRMAKEREMIKMRSRLSSMPDRPFPRQDIPLKSPPPKKKNQFFWHLFTRRQLPNSTKLDSFFNIFIMITHFSGNS